MRKILALVLLSLAAAPLRAQVLTGLDVLEKQDFSILKGKRVGLITNQTGRDAAGRSTIDVLYHAPGVSLKAIFSPEHGLSGETPAGRAVASSQDPETGLPVYSLYGKSPRPTPEMLAGLDALVFDIQDAGTRFYTFLTTMAMAQEAAAQAGIPFIVLDRPNPLGGEVIEGPLKIPEISAFTCYLPVPIRHGMTDGEVARLYNATLDTPARLIVVPMRGWKRSMLWKDTGLPWIPPSPNLRNPTEALLYPGIGLFEATDVSVGRGTDTPFEWIGAPWMDNKGAVKALRKLDLPGFKFKVEFKTPRSDLFAGRACHGIRITVSDPEAARPVDLFVQLAAILRSVNEFEFQPRFDDMRLMMGNDEYLKNFLADDSPDDQLARMRADDAAFARTRRPYLLYP